MMMIFDRGFVEGERSVTRSSIIRNLKAMKYQDHHQLKVSFILRFFYVSAVL
jgi:hypothetical protein